MKKRIYRSVSVKQVNVSKVIEGMGKRVVFGNDAAKDRWVGAFVDENGEVALTIRWDVIEDQEVLMSLLNQIRHTGIEVEVAVEPTGSYADAMVAQYENAGFPVFWVSAKHTHDYAEIYDGVPSSHDGKAAAMVAVLHMQRREHSRRWPKKTESERNLRALTDQIDWLKQELLRIENRLEGKLARHWPELSRILDITTATPMHLLKDYGTPRAVRECEDAARQMMAKVSRGLLEQKKQDAVIASAKTTIGVAMTSEEVLLIQGLAQRALEIRSELHDLEARIHSKLNEFDTAGPISEFVGKTTTGVLIGTLGDFRRYTTVGALVKAIGLNLKEHSSGKHKGQLKISKRGSSRVRRWLYMAVLRWVKADRVARAWYLRKVEQAGGIKRKGLISLMRKLVAALYHIAHGREFDPAKLFDLRRLSPVA